jgi:hypothetical protein
LDITTGGRLADPHTIAEISVVGADDFGARLIALPPP